MASEDLTPEDEAVRRVLASLSSSADPAPIPSHVAARLDDVLAGLTADRAPAANAPVVDPVVNLASHRRRRLAAVLVAAASVSVIALAVGNVFGTGSDPSMSTADKSAGRAGAPQDLATPEVGSAPSQEGAVPGYVADGALPKIRSRSLTVDVQRIADLDLVRGQMSKEKRPALSGARTASGCQSPVVGRREGVVEVRLDGARATLLLRAPHSGTREAEVYSCDDGTSAVATTTVSDR